MVERMRRTERNATNWYFNLFSDNILLASIRPSAGNIKLSTINVCVCAGIGNDAEAKIPIKWISSAFMLCHNDLPTKGRSSPTDTQIV